MTNVNKLNHVQKNIMADFMTAHPSLAKNLIPNCAQGRATAERLWATLATKLNAAGPPVKEAKAWKKVFADQKYQAKKKLSFNKISKNKTGGGPYEEKILTQSEEQIIEASGLEVAVEGLKSVKTFGASVSQRARPSTPSPILNAPTTSKALSVSRNVSIDSLDALYKDLVESSCKSVSEEEKENKTPKTPKTPKTRKRKIEESIKEDPKLKLLQESVSIQDQFQRRIESKLDRLLEIQEKMLKLKEEKQQNHTALTKVKLQIKNIELEMLKASSQNI